MTTLLDIILVLVVLEAAVIAAFRVRNNEASAIPADLAYLGSGFFLMLAVRLAWTESSPVFPVLALVTLAGISHVFDIVRRFRKAA
ncbi:hypothetical protein KKP04_05595 [Rhodomicrobium sp. Az07]|uniref:hypothetical protein n=1 Tax=Rhodomicrobium sp. Az07 TaxID=2839034 RepID=UPI001BE8160D|nr:hypothetical protein [Rhodomicrobium sp. Az07]MBT3070339.1 hypothetical protein [Rhodomicrobium sp. Az07]